jgi:BirA family biotin operon repressor/biotin-[acetyl-CoA-carboxylase] ligase
LSERMFEEEQLRELLPISGIGIPLFLHAEVGSTNDIAIDLAKDGTPHGALIVAEAQTKGRGRGGRSWTTIPGSSLAMSVLLRQTAVEAHAWARLHALGALAVLEALQQYALQPKIKWPNDVLLQNKKVAGILLDVVWEGNECDFIVLGIGMNIYDAPSLKERSSDLPAISVMEALEHKPDPYKILVDILGGIGTWLPRVHSPQLIEMWQENLAYLGCDIVLGQSSEIIQGKLLGLHEDGKLKILNKDDEVIEVGVGQYPLRLKEGWVEVCRSTPSSFVGRGGG